MKQQQSIPSRPYMMQGFMPVNVPTTYSMSFKATAHT